MKYSTYSHIVEYREKTYTDVGLLMFREKKDVTSLMLERKNIYTYMHDSSLCDFVVSR